MTFKWELVGFFFQIKFPHMYSIALNTAYLLHIMNILAVVTNGLFPDPLSKGIYHSHPLVQGSSEQMCLRCSWCLMTARGTRVVTRVF